MTRLIETNEATRRLNDWVEAQTAVYEARKHGADQTTLDALFATAKVAYARHLETAPPPTTYNED